MFGWLVVVGLHFGFKRRMIWVREKVRWVHANESYIFKKRLKIKPKLLTNYHVIKCFWY